jgi:hypothetical protein
VLQQLFFHALAGSYPYRKLTVEKDGTVFVNACNAQQIDQKTIVRTLEISRQPLAVIAQMMAARARGCGSSGIGGAVIKRGVITISHQADNVAKGYKNILLFEFYTQFNFYGVAFHSKTFLEVKKIYKRNTKILLFNMKIKYVFGYWLLVFGLWFMVREGDWGK